MNATIYDVARQAGVSIATVSRVLNAPLTVNHTTRQRVFRAIDDLHFVPKAEATERARRTNRRIGVLAPFFTYPSFVQRLAGISSTLTQGSYELIVYSVDTVEQMRNALQNIPVSRRIDGLILMSIAIDHDTVRNLLSHHLPAVTIEVGRPEITSVEIDNVQGGRLAAKYLLGKGHRRLGFIGGDIEIAGYTPHTSEQRLAGFRAELKEANIELAEEQIELGITQVAGARLCAERLLTLSDRPEAIFAGNDTVAMGVLKAARELKLHVPGDVALLGFDDLQMAEYIGLTTISQSLEESGRVAVELLLARMADNNRPVQHVRLPLKVIQRETA